MTSRELEILNIVYKLGGQCSIQTVSKKTRVSLDYTSYLSKILLKQNFIKTINNTIVLTPKGKTFLAPPKNEAEQELKFLGFTPYLKEEDKISKKLAMKRLPKEEPQLVSRSIYKNPTVEKIDGRAIEASIQRLIYIAPVANQDQEKELFSGKVKTFKPVKSRDKIRRKGRFKSNNPKNGKRHKN